MYSKKNFTNRHRRSKRIRHKILFDLVMVNRQKDSLAFNEMQSLNRARIHHAFCIPKVTHQNEAQNLGKTTT